MAVKKGMLWGSVVLGIALGVVCYLYFKSPRNKNPHVITHKINLIEKNVSSKEPSPLTGQKGAIDHAQKTIVAETVPAERKNTAATDENLCAAAEKQIEDYLHYLDKKDYVKRLSGGLSMEQKYNEIIKKLSKHPPVPAGEGLKPSIMVSNVFHFFRVLPVDDIRLLKTIVSREHDSVEVFCRTLYQWVMADDCKSTSVSLIRPDRETVYKYAGFFVNTTGGRACLLRRPGRLRFILRYYCVLALNDANKRGLNKWGINIAPFVSVLKKEATHYPDLIYQNQYVEALGRIESSYIKDRNLEKSVKE